MKKILFLSLLCLVASEAFATDTVHMKNGDVYKGEIVEQKFNKYIQLKLSDGSEKHLNWKDIDDVEKEKSAADEPKAPDNTSETTPTDENVGTDATETDESTEKKDAIETGDESKKKYFSDIIYIAEAVSPESSYVMLLNGNATSNTDKDKSSTFFGLQLLWESRGRFGLAFDVLRNNYKYSDSTPEDSHLIITLSPRWRVSKEEARIRSWFGFGLGWMHTSWGQIGLVDSGISIIMKSTTSNSLVLMPQLGFDMDISKNAFLRLFGSFTRSDLSFELNANSTATGALLTTATVDVTRTWYGIGAGIGFYL